MTQLGDMNYCENVYCLLVDHICYHLSFIWLRFSLDVGTQGRTEDFDSGGAQNNPHQTGKKNDYN